MATTYRAQVRFPYDSGLPADVSVNTFHFRDPGGLADPLDIVQMLDDFYTATYSGESGALASYLSSTLGADAGVKIYDLSESEPRVPVVDDTFSFTPNTGTGGLPEEVALCISFQGNTVSGVPQARRRGRIYLGPLSLLAIEGAAASDTVWPMPARPATDLKTRARASCLHLVDDAIAASMIWVVHSNVGSGLDSTVQNGWVDDAFDIQRRRGVLPTSRTTWAA